ncbi:MAG: hypothetical protein AAGK78_01585, partial [Planctomycetota bacterium]
MTSGRAVFRRVAAMVALMLAGLLAMGAAPTSEGGKVSEGARDIASGAKRMAEGADKITHGVADSIRKQWLSDGKI